MARSAADILQFLPRQRFEQCAVSGILRICGRLGAVHEIWAQIRTKAGRVDIQTITPIDSSLVGKRVVAVGVCTLPITGGRKLAAASLVEVQQRTGRRAVDVFCSKKRKEAMRWFLRQQGYKVVDEFEAGFTVAVYDAELPLLADLFTGSGGKICVGDKLESRCRS